MVGNENTSKNLEVGKNKQDYFMCKKKKRGNFQHLNVLLFPFAKLHPTFCNPMNCSPSGSSVHGVLQARILEWVALSFSRGSSQIRD